MQSPEQPNSNPVEPVAKAREQRRLATLEAKYGSRQQPGDRGFAKEGAIHDRNITERGSVAKKKYLEINPGDNAGAEIVGGLIACLDNDRRLHSKELRGREAIFDLVVKQAAFNNKWTEYVHEHSEDEAFLIRHWNAVDRLISNIEERDSLRLTRAGIITQVAILKVFENLGIKCVSANDTEDGKIGIDFWLEPGKDDHIRQLVQVKGRGNVEHVEIVETDTTSPLTVRVNDGGKEALVSSADMEGILKLRRKLGEYSNDEKMAGVRGFYIVIPNRKEHINRHTGKPTPRLVQEVLMELKRLNYQFEDAKGQVSKISEGPSNAAATLDAPYA